MKIRLCKEGGFFMRCEIYFCVVKRRNPDDFPFSC